MLMCLSYCIRKQNSQICIYGLIYIVYQVIVNNGVLYQIEFHTVQCSEISHLPPLKYERPHSFDFDMQVLPGKNKTLCLSCGNCYKNICLFYICRSLSGSWIKYIRHPFPEVDPHLRHATKLLLEYGLWPHSLWRLHWWVGVIIVRVQFLYYYLWNTMLCILPLCRSHNFSDHSRST